jgi:hypothetical protein
VKVLPITQTNLYVSSQAGVNLSRLIRARTNHLAGISNSSPSSA